MSDHHANPPTEIDAPPLNLPAVVRAAGFLVSYEALPSTIDAPAICTWPLDTTKGRARLHQTINGKSMSLWDLCESGPFTFEVTDLAAHFASYESEDKPGEVIEGPRICMIGPKGVYQSGSEYVFRALQELAKLEGLPPWNPSVVLCATRVPTRNKRTRMALELIDRGGFEEDADL
jgi:hypothetical protein